MSNSLSWYGLEDEWPFLLEITGLAETCLSITSKEPKSSASLAPFLSFMHKFVEIHGPKFETNKKNLAKNEPVQVTARNLMLLSYSAVTVCSTEDENSVSQSIAPPMFDTLSSCAKICPIFLLSLSRDSQQNGEVVLSSINAVPVILKSNDVDTIMSSLNFLKEMVSYCSAS